MKTRTPKKTQKPAARDLPLKPGDTCPRIVLPIAIEHVCQQCGEAFVVERSDARYCSEACRARAWRLIAHRDLRHNPNGWVIPANEAGQGERRTCGLEVRHPDHWFCPKRATWLRLSCTNHTRAHVRLTYRCEEHYALEREELQRPCDPEASCHRGIRCPAASAARDLEGAPPSQVARGDRTKRAATPRATRQNGKRNTHTLAPPPWRPGVDPDDLDLG